MTRDVEQQAGALMRRGQAGDQDAYGALLELLVPATRAYARARVGAAPWLDDVVQETLIAVHVARHTYDPDRPFGPWFHAIASNRLIDAMRRARRQSFRELPADAVPEIAGHAAGGGLEIDEVETIRGAVMALPLRQRQVIAALKLDELSVREIAGRLRISESAVKVAAHRGYRTLRRVLQGFRREH